MKKLLKVTIALTAIEVAARAMNSKETKKVPLQIWHDGTLQLTKEGVKIITPRIKLKAPTQFI